MSKKLIAVASAAALALTALVGIAPAHASVTAAITGTSVAGPGTALVPVRQNVPHQNTLAGEGSAAIVFSSTADGDKITITTSGKVKITAAETAGSADINVTNLGTQSYSATASGATLNAFAFTTDEVTTEIKWSATRPSTGATSSGSLFIKGSNAGVAEMHTLEVLQAPSTIAKGASAEIRVLIKDVFGNPIVATVNSANVTGASSTQSLVWDEANKWHDATITSSTDRAFALTIDANGATDDDDTEVVGFPGNKMSTVVIVNSAATATANATAVAQIAALTAQLANSRGKDVSVTKKKYNNLAKRWNSAFPGQKVALKQ